MSDDTKNGDNEKKPDHEPPAGAETTGTWGRGRKADRVHGDRQVDRPAQEGEARGRDLLGLVRRGGGRSRPPGDVRLQRRSRCGVGVSCTWAPSGRSASTSRRTGRSRPCRRGSSRTSRRGSRFTDLVFVDPVGTGFSRVDRARDEGRRRQGRRQARRRARPEGVLRLQARPRVALRVHGALALRARPLGLAHLHRRRELRRLSRRSPRSHAAGGGGHRPERRDPHLACARDHRPRSDRLRDPRLDRPRSDDGCGRIAPRALPRISEGHIAREGAARGRGIRNRRLRVLPRARSLAPCEGAHADPHAARRHPGRLARRRPPCGGPRRDPHLRS